MDESFTYMICSDDRKNTTLPADTFPIYYDVDFGGFSEQYDNYMCEVVSFAMTNGIPAASTYLMFCSDNLGESGYFCRNKLSPKDNILSIVPMNALTDAYIQSDGGNIKFRVNNCRYPRQIIFYFLKPDFSLAIVGTDVNVGAGVETKWILTLKMTPIK
jgi:hypothetical protein